MKQFNVTVNGKLYEVVVEEKGAVNISAPFVAPAAAPLPKAAPAPAAAPSPAAPAPAAVSAGAKVVAAPMPGKIMSVNVKPGDLVKRGDLLLILEAMKMQNEIMAPDNGKITDIKVSAGQTVSTGDAMVVWE